MLPQNGAVKLEKDMKMDRIKYKHDEGEFDSDRNEPRGDANKFKKPKRPTHAAKRSKDPERLHGIHRRRNKRMSW
jgi:hypothetical protein